MNDLLIYLLNDRLEIIANCLKEFGYTNILSGEAGINELIKLNPDLIIIGNNHYNLDLCREITSADLAPLVIVNSEYPKKISQESLNQLAILGYIEDLSNDCRVKIEISTFLEKVKNIKLSKGFTMWFKGVLNTTKDAIIGIDENNIIKFLNPVAQQIIGVEESKAIGLNTKRVLIFKENNDFISVRLKDYESMNFEGEVFNRIYKKYINVSGNITNIHDHNGFYHGKVITLKDIGQIKDLFSRISYQSSHDNLTGLINRKSFIDHADQFITLSKYDESTHGLVVISMDKFKVVNDTCGHAAGDELLRKIAYTISLADENDEYIKGRISGDEFGVLLKNSTLSETKHFTSLLKRKISGQDFIWGDKEFPIMCSFGVVDINSKTIDHYSLLAAVDDAVAICKQKGGNRIEIYSNSAIEYNKRRGDMLWIHKLKDAISYDQFCLYYQDIKPICDDHMSKVEILLRIKDFNGDILNPNDFIPSAEQYGIMPEIDKIVIDKAAEFMKLMLDKKKLNYRTIFSINLSATSLLDKSLPGYIQNTFTKYNVPSTLFCFEITETTAIKNMETAQFFINTLKRIGCTFSLDDFGSGFSNFSYLKDLDVDYLKIDGSFVQDITTSEVNLSMVEAINKIGHIMKMKTVAEYAENDDIIEILKKIGVDFLQGYGISKPTPIENLLL